MHTPGSVRPERPARCAADAGCGTRFPDLPAHFRELLARLDSGRIELRMETVALRAAVQEALEDAASAARAAAASPDDSNQNPSSAWSATASGWRSSASR